MEIKMLKGLEKFMSDFSESYWNEHDIENMDDCDGHWEDMFDAIEEKYNIELECEERDEIEEIFENL
tara:strand:- start:329 stop:529 length:201 start_codon:yes stop_codon:yes gene_type:complete